MRLAQQLILHIFFQLIKSVMNKQDGMTIRIRIPFAPTPGAKIPSPHKFFQSLKLTGIVQIMCSVITRRRAAERIHIFHAGPMIYNIVEQRVSGRNICLTHKLLY